MIAALLLAAGASRRFGGGLQKLTQELNGKPVVRWSAEPLIGPPGNCPVLPRSTCPPAGRLGSSVSGAGATDGPPPTTVAPGSSLPAGFLGGFAPGADVHCGHDGRSSG